MKKIIYALASVTLTASLMVGCGANAAGTQSKQATKSASTEDGSTKSKNIQKVDLAGEVASIDGNKITIKVIKAPEAPQGNNQKDASKDVDKEKSQDNNKDGQGQAQKVPANMKREFTGENKDITISDGIQLATMIKGKQGVEKKDLTVNDIKVGDILQIIYSDKEKETISNIYVKPATNANTK